MRVQSPTMILGILGVLLALSIGLSAATIRVAILDPGGGEAESSAVDVLLYGEQIEKAPKDELTFKNVAYGPHELVIKKEEEVIHSRKLYIDRDDILLTVQLGWEDLIDVFSWTEWEYLALENADFEQTLVNDTPPGWRSGWHWGKGGTFARRPHFSLSDEQAFSGSYSLKMDGSLAKGAETPTVVKPVPAVPGSVYTASAHIYCLRAVSPHPYMVISFWDATGQRIHLKTVRSAGREGEWEEFSVTEIAPAGAAEVSVLLVGNSNYTGVSLWDDITLKVAHPVKGDRGEE